MWYRASSLIKLVLIEKVRRWYTYLICEIGIYCLTDVVTLWYKNIHRVSLEEQNRLLTKDGNVYFTRRTLNPVQMNRKKVIFYSKILKTRRTCYKKIYIEYTLFFLFFIFLHFEPYIILK